MAWLRSPLLLLSCISSLTMAQAAPFSISLKQAESNALSSSQLLKSYVSEQEAARSQADAQFQNLFPRLTFQASYQYNAQIPTVSFGFGQALPFGTHSTYSIGPALNYTLWDSFSQRRGYQAASLLEQARSEDRLNTQIQILSSTRSAYVQVQLGLEELKVIHDSLQLSRAQNNDVLTRYHAGAAARLDVVTSERAVLNYEIQFKQRQSELVSSLRDLFTLLGDDQPKDLSRPGPAGVPNLTFELQLESLDQLLAEQSAPRIQPDQNLPQIKTQSLQAGAFELNAEGQKAHLLPSLQLSAGVDYLRPNIPNPPTYWQESVGVALSMPLFFGDPTLALSHQQRSEAEAARYRAEQTRLNVDRDFSKARDTLQSLLDQKTLAVQDVKQSEEEARLYYTSYKAGKLNLIDVQNANNQALQAKVNAARIEAQILNQIFVLKALADEDFRHD